jgi:hypothetical protein
MQPTAPAPPGEGEVHASAFTNRTFLTPTFSRQDREA